MGRQTIMNKITSPEKIAQINPENTRLIEDYLNYMHSIKRSKQTIEVYRNDLQIVFVWCLDNIGNKFFVDWSKRDVIALQNWMINSNQNSPARVRRVKAVLSSLSNFIESVLDDEYPNFRNIIHKIENPPNQPVREKVVLSDEDVQKILDTLVERGRYKQACLFALASYSGRRKSELVRFRMCDFQDDNLICDGALYKTKDKIQTKGRGDGKFLHCFTLAKPFKPYLDLWIAQREKEGIDSVWLFPNPFNSDLQMKSSAINGWFEYFGKIINRPVYVHCLRHYFTTMLVRAGIPDSVITDLVGWESSEMCKIYTDIEAEEQFNMYFKDGDICVSKNGGLNSL